jgi:glyoxylase-like metal-dependent hydrolase (beta-lactamase superfamily II)
VLDYSIWVLQTGIMPNFPKSGLLYGAHNQGTLAVPLGLAVIKGGGHTIAVDTGFRAAGRERELAELYGVESPRGTVELLDAIGINPDDVDTLIATHAHWDHMGSLETFPNATVHIQERELLGWLRSLGRPQQMRWLRFGIDPADFTALFQAALDGRVRVHDGEVPDLLPGIDLAPAFDTHTFGLQYVVVGGEAGDRPESWVIAGDAVLCYENLESDDGFVPLGQALGSQERILEVFATIYETVGGETSRVLPFHDLSVYSRFPSCETLDGLRVAEVALAQGEASRV